MDSPYLMGIRKHNHLETFPASPTILTMLQVDEHIKNHFLVSRNKHIAAKYQYQVVHHPKLRPYQNADVNFLLQMSKGKGVFNQQRLGKTPTTLVTMRLKNQNRNLIIVPKSTIYQWSKEFKRWHGGNLIELKDSWQKAKRIKAYKNAPKDATLIVNYEKIRIDFEQIKEFLSPFDAIVLDEAHFLRNYTGLSTNARSPKTVKAIINMRKESKDAYALTGTPTPNKEADIVGILAFLYPDLYQYYWNVIDYYFKKETEHNHAYDTDYYTVSGFLNDYKKKELLEFLETFSIQRKRKDVIEWLPKVDYEIVRLDPTKKQEKYNRELKEYYETDGVVCENPLTVMMAMRQVANYPAILELDKESPKFNWILEHLQDYSEKPVVIVSAFSSILKELHAFLKEKGIPNKFMYGQTSSKNRQTYIDEFQSGDYNVLLANIQVAKEGITLSRAEEIIFMDPSLTYTDNLQMGDRFLPTTPEEAVKKEGQKIINLVIRKSIDVYITQSLKRKAKKTDIINNYLKYLAKDKQNE